jgi:two-component system OmpR family response regulator
MAYIPAVTAADTSKKPRPARPLKLLVADDDRDAVLTLSTVLQDEGHQVLEVYRGDAVLQLVRRYRPDAVLLDIGMPGLTGFEIARQLRDQLGRDCPMLIAITAWAQSSARELGRMVGFNHYLLKPFAAEELLALLAPLAASDESGGSPG